MTDTDRKEDHKEPVPTEAKADDAPPAPKSLNAAAAEWKPNFSAPAFVPKSNTVPGHPLKSTAPAFMSSAQGQGVPGMVPMMPGGVYGMPQQMMPGEGLR
jgi:hypothetical protein